MSLTNNEELKKIIKEDFTKSLTHERTKPDTSPPSARVTSQSVNKKSQNSSKKKDK